MADDKTSKQATLGYVRDSQLTLGRFFGSNANPPQAPKKQTTLAFGGKKKKTNDTPNEPENASAAQETEDVEMKTETEIPQPDASESESTSGFKRDKADAAEESDASDVQPAPKRRRKASKAAVEESPAEVDISDVEVAEEDTASESDSETKPEVKKKQMEKVQATLKSSGKDAYPDWKAGDPVPYAALCTTFSLIEMTSKRLTIIALCSQFLQQVLRLSPDDLLPTVQLMICKLAADYTGIELGIGESLIMKAIGESTGRSLAVIRTDQHEIGDLGLVAAKSRSNQPTMFKPKALTVRGVHEGLLGIAKVSGHGSQDKKISGIKKLLSAADAEAAGKGGKGIDITKDKGGPSEAKFIVRFLEGKLRLGLAEKTLLVALAQAVVCHEAAVAGEKAPSAEKMAERRLFSRPYSHGIFNLGDHCKLQPGVPLKPMLAKPTKSITEVLDRFEGKDFTCEYKYDGERAQIHFVAPSAVQNFPASTQTLQKESKGLASIFSRNSEDLSKKYPDILGKLDTWVKDGVTSFVLDCETVAWDTVNKKVLPFQQLMTRKKKDVKAEDVKVKVCVFAFDLLFFNGEPCVKKSLRERRELLHECFQPVEGEFQFAQYGNTNELDEIQVLLDESVKASCEGLMVKMLDTSESGYEPSKRSRNWLKVKKDYLAGRTSVYGAFLLAAFNPNNETYETICNIGTGFSEAVLEELHKVLSPMVIDRPKPFYAHSSVPKDQPDVWFEPRLVWEVKTADLTLSPRYKAAADEFNGTAGEGKGVSLRFPRYIKARDDKKPEQATTTRAVAEMYRKQEAVAKENAGKKGVDDDFEY
ncbi:hypothetical protein N7470_002824 [Penicillium chermesinum]|nr:hypothetical protein N7470_002824 [Penicillium chermesinum]